MRKILCDLCKKEIDEADVRHIFFRKANEDKNVRPMFEICSICLDKKYNEIKE